MTGRIEEEHEIVKRFFWEKFLHSFVHSTQKVNYRTIIFDGSSGEGRYGEEWPTDIEGYGSPLISLRVAVECFHTQNHESGQFKKFNPLDEQDRVNDELCCDEIKDLFEGSSIKIYLVEKDEEKFKCLLKNAKEVIMKYGVGVVSCLK